MIGIGGPLLRGIVRDLLRVNTWNEIRVEGVSAA